MVWFYTGFKFKKKAYLHNYRVQIDKQQLKIKKGAI